MLWRVRAVRNVCTLVLFWGRASRAHFLFPSIAFVPHAAPNSSLQPSAAVLQRSRARLMAAPRVGGSGARLAWVVRGILKRKLNLLVLRKRSDVSASALPPTQVGC